MGVDAHSSSPHSKMILFFFFNGFGSGTIPIGCNHPIFTHINFYHSFFNFFQKNLNFFISMVEIENYFFQLSISIIYCYYIKYNILNIVPDFNPFSTFLCHDNIWSAMIHTTWQVYGGRCSKHVTLMSLVETSIMDFWNSFWNINYVNLFVGDTKHG